MFSSTEIKERAKMVERIEYRIGDCSCFFSSWFPNLYGKICFRDRALYLGKKCTARYVEGVINHEWIHLIIDDIMGRSEVGFDSLFHGVNTLASNGMPKD
jgi:hypothetical protein